MPIANQWSDEVKAFALKRAADGISASLIAKQIWIKFEVRKTRNAVIGLVHRCGQSLRGDAGTKSATKANKARRARKQWTPPKKPSPIRLITEPLPPRQETDIARVSFLDLEQEHCRFIPGDSAGVPQDQPLYCGLPRFQGSSYCPAHTARCSNAYEARRAEPARPHLTLVEA